VGGGGTVALVEPRDHCPALCRRSTTCAYKPQPGRKRRKEKKIALSEGTWLRSFDLCAREEVFVFTSVADLGPGWWSVALAIFSHSAVLQISTPVKNIYRLHLLRRAMPGVVLEPPQVSSILSHLVRAAPASVVCLLHHCRHGHGVAVPPRRRSGGRVWTEIASIACSSESSLAARLAAALGERRVSGVRSFGPMLTVAFEELPFLPLDIRGLDQLVGVARS